MTTRRRSTLAIGVHLLVGLAFLFCWAAGWFEFTRARGGRTIAWVYTFEWPFFAVMIALMWWRQVTGRDGRPSGHRSSTPDIPEDDPGLRAWRDYLDELAHDDAKTDRAPGSG